MLEAMESAVNGDGFSQLQSYGDSSEEELSVLPRHTKVVVTGNNRTKSVLVGLQGVVKKAVGLGGWHWLVIPWNLFSILLEMGGAWSLDFIWELEELEFHGLYDAVLVLTNGIEVKLQRNALSVIEAPTGNEEDDDIEFENVHWNGSDMGGFLQCLIFLIFLLLVPLHLGFFNVVCLIFQFPASDDTQKSHRSRHRAHKSSGSCHKTMSRSLSCDSQLKGTVSTSRGSMKVDLSKLEIAALWRYWRHFNLVDTIPNPSKEQLVDVVQRHFMSQQMDELQVIVGFVHAAKRLKTVCK
ncbi:Histone deacetylase complex subunit SAP30/SAP30-like protein [Gossypium australe]|uniref:Histone deacetylase complex subunit SAP30/SAP30-like protein n=1 Tax=Gossypium australe TaxID=47621 RepID=A0A5B6X3W2_9ROSI|nr:Histone deacetylase complex subunit SAP30/SAP30-like protein [Gossypium australe]